ncbi:MAG TPA: DedA family protein [Polyangiaceae bacterium]|nr:DedA family protein [Polyangiaceae bacterium]
MLETFILRWGYAAVAVGTFLEGEIVLIAGGALAHRGLLSLPFVVLAAFLGSVAGDQLWFYVGKRAGRSFVTRRPRLREHAHKAERRLARRGTAFVFGFRFLYGLRTVTPVVLGATGYPALRFLLLNTGGAALWSVLFGGLGFALGASLEALLRRAVRVEELLAAALVVGLLLWLGFRGMRHRRHHDHPGSFTAQTTGSNE